MQTDFPVDIVIKHSSSQCIEEYGESLKSYDVTIRQLSCGAFSGRTTTISLGGLKLVKRSALVKYASTGYFGDEILFLFQPSGDSCLVNGLQIDGGRQLAVFGVQEVTNIIPGQSIHLLVAISRKSLSDYLLEEECDQFIAALVRLNTFFCDPCMKAETTSRLAHIFMELERLEHPMAADQVHTWCQLVIDCIYDYLLFHTGFHQQPLTGRERLLQRALGYIEKNPECNLEGLAQGSCGSKRALQYVFANVLGMKPIHYAKCIKLNRIFQELASGRNTGTLSELVARHEFSNPGRVVREYTDFFGHHPKELLKRKAPL